MKNLSTINRKNIKSFFSIFTKIKSVKHALLFSLSFFLFFLYGHSQIISDTSAAALKKQAGYSQFHDKQIFNQLSGAAQNLLLNKFGKKTNKEINDIVVPKPIDKDELGPGRMMVPANSIVNDPTGEGAPAGFTQSETAIVLGAGSAVIAGFNDSGSRTGPNNRFTGYSTSSNMGTTWTDQGLLPGDNDAGDPVLVRDNTLGRTYLVTLNWTGSGLRMFRSNDDMATVLTAVECFPGFGGGDFIDKPWIAVDNFPGAGQGNVYVAAKNFPGGAAGSQPGGIYLFRSTDNGATFAPAGGTLPLSRIDPSCNQGANVAVGPDHSVYVFWWDCSTTPRQLLVSRSTDQGATFGASILITNLLSTGTNGSLGLPFRSNSFPQGAVNPVSGDVYVAFNDNPVGVDRGNIYFTQSSDNGATWSAPILVNDDGTTNDQEFPAIAVSPDGLNLALAWYDNRSDPANNLIERWAATACFSGGLITFGPNILISTASFPPVFNVDGFVNSTYMGDYDQMAADNNFFYTTWGDNRSGDPDVWFAKQPFISSVIAGDANLCGSSNTSTDLIVTITGGAGPFEIVYSDGSTNTTVSNYNSGDLIPVSPTATTVYTLVSVDGCNANISGSATVVVVVKCDGFPWAGN